MTVIPKYHTNQTLYKQAESDAKFIRSFSINVRGRDTNLPLPPRLMRTLSTNQSGVADGTPNMQVFLRSYSFSRKESMSEKVRNCANQIKRSASMSVPNKKVSGGRKTKKISSAMNVIRRLLSFTSTRV